MKLKHALFSAGVCAGSILVSLRAQTSGSAGSASGTAGASTTPGGATGGATTGTSATTTNPNSTPAAPSAINPPTPTTGANPTGAPNPISPVNSSPTLSVGAGTQSDFGPIAPTGSTGTTTNGLPNTTLPPLNSTINAPIGSPTIDPIITSSGAPRRASPGTAPIGPEPMTQPSSIGGQTAITTGAASVTRGPLDNPTLSPTGRTSSSAAATTPRDALGLPAAVNAPSAPPPPLAESVPTSPGANHTWVPGHYTLTNGQWSWTTGSWVVPPAVGATWVDGRYDTTTQRWLPGHWEPGVRTQP